MTFTWESCGQYMQRTSCRRYAIRNDQAGDPAWTAWALGRPAARELGGYDSEIDAKAACELDVEQAELAAAGAA